MVVIEVFENYNSASEIAGNGAWAEANYHLVKLAEDEERPSEDFDTTENWTGFPTLPLIDASTMQVVNIDCFFLRSMSDCVSMNMP